MAAVNAVNQFWLNLTKIQPYKESCCNAALCRTCELSLANPYALSKKCSS